MKGEEFRERAREAFDAIMQLHEVKGRDYSGEDECFSNFRRHAAELGLEPQQIWAVYASKHWDAVMTYVREGQNDHYKPSEPIAGRIDDLILYLFMLREMEAEAGGAKMAEPLPDCADCRHPETAHHGALEGCNYANGADQAACPCTAYKVPAGMA